MGPLAFSLPHTLQIPVTQHTNDLTNTNETCLSSTDRNANEEQLAHQINHHRLGEPGAGV